MEKTTHIKFMLTAINAKYIHSNPALYSLRAYAAAGEHGAVYRNAIEIVEYTINNRQEDILADIYARQPDVLAFSCYIWNWNMIQELLADLHTIMPELPIWLGGPEVSYDAETILRNYPMVTGIMRGEGEATFRELLQYYIYQDISMEKIAGLIIRRAGDMDEIMETPCRELTDMNSLPFLYEDLSAFENRIIYYESGRGCPFCCSYCLSAIDKRVRLRDMTIVKKELQFFLDHKVAQVKFIDRTFNCSHEHATDIWRYIKENDNGVTNFHFEVAADILNDEELELLASMRPGLVQLEIGVQSANKKTIEAINRRMDIEKLAEIVGRIHAGANIHVHLDLIAGLPYEDAASFASSLNTVYAMQPNQLQLGFLKVLKGSPMHAQAAQYGICHTKKPPYEVLYTDWLTYADIRRLKQIEEMVELYYNSSQFMHTLPALQQIFDTPYAMFAALADYYEQNGLFINSPARAYRYETLLHFACAHDHEREALYKELLTFDMYLRENLKSRPVFAASLDAEKETIRAFYEQEEQQPYYLKTYEGYQARQLIKMTHMEPFAYPVWEEDVTCVSQKMDVPSYVLFDYKQRNPLDNAATYYIIKR